jgi:ectoine hydroxylase-related dioxygenase (phytanoyl-CoA dioxygenase family)
MASAVVPAAFLDALSTELEPLLRRAARSSNIRNILDLECVRKLSTSTSVRRVVETALGRDSFAVRGLLFDKTHEANWKVAWHQDLTVAVRERHEVPGFGPWSEKAGIAHVQAPAEILEQMLAVRVHLDDCGTQNGPLRVLPGSHRYGKLNSDQIERWRADVTAVECTASRGSMVPFRPLLLHSSSQALKPGRRRVMHLEFACADLPLGLKWHWRV